MGQEIFSDRKQIRGIQSARQNIYKTQFKMNISDKKVQDISYCMKIYARRGEIGVLLVSFKYHF